MKIVRYACYAALAVASLAPDFAGATSLKNPQPALADAFRDLPGVKPPADVPPQDAPPVCEEVFIERDFPFEPTNAPRYERRYRCVKDGVTFESDRLPLNRDRIQRGLPW
ncbi:hypothetical protein SAMN05880582_103204 [Rhizobium sp. RU20A]|uniref:hypothetical protein n=1 Tax=Rhizobium sp. RU20A TaxID=1907412 RepID=UPI000956B1B0|nr:hypothetical protein [Rhizobium sp. RU20A]SIQ74616.1 hypothetical protein SAMN05880582_103204 [Rhizobium sp. RU20A]